jgi:hypothetical protein
MSRLTYRQIAGAVLAIGALVLGLTAAAAIGWGGENQGKGQDYTQKNDHGSKDQSGGKQDYGNKEQSGGNHDYGNKKPPTETVPPRTVTSPPVTETSPPVVVTSPPSTVTVQGPPSVTTQTKTKTVTTKAKKVLTRTTPPPPPKAPPLTPVAERKRLASTGLSPWLIALFGAALLGGGSVLFRRALARD